MPEKVVRWRRRSVRISTRVPASSAARGSSSRRRRGSVARARASATRCACPPERWAGRLSVCVVSPNRSSHPAAMSRACRFCIPMRRSPKATLSSALRFGKSRKSWNTTAMRRCSGGNQASVAGSSSTSPSSSMRPASIGRSPASARSAVVLPDPFGPRSATVSPSAISSSTARSRSPRRNAMLPYKPSVAVMPLRTTGRAVRAKR